MLELFSKDNAIAVLKSDHEKVKSLFKQFEETDNMREKKRIAAEAIMELKIHAEIEEKLFYPSVREDVEDDIMNEADEEHHVAKLLIAELDQMDGSEDHWEAKFIVLAENIRHHIKEEEGEMFPQARMLDVDFEVLGHKLMAMKQMLKKDGVPASDEERLMMRNGLVDSPARAAKRKSPSRTAAKSRFTGSRKVAGKSSAKSAKASAPRKTKAAKRR